MKISIESAPPTVGQIQAAGKKIRALLLIFAVVFAMAFIGLILGANQSVAAVIMAYAGARLTFLYFSKAHRRFQPISAEEKNAVTAWEKKSTGIQRYSKQVALQGRELVHEEFIAMQRFLQKENVADIKGGKKN